MSKILELSSASKGGRKRIEIVLHKIPNEILEVNRNGIHWTEKNTQANIESVSGIPICAEFLDEDKEIPLGHGYTSTERIGGKDTPLFENSVVVGSIESGEIKDVEVNGETIKALVGIGFLYNQRFPKFTQWVKKNLIFSKVDTSIEIVGKEENENRILYEEGASDSYRIPKVYDYSGVAILSVLPADSDAIVLECATANNQNKEEQNMDEKVLKDLIVSTISETNSKNDEFLNKINELNTALDKKDAEIKELKDSKESETNSLEEKERKIEELNSKIADLEKELAECKKSEQNAALDNAVKDFSDDEKKFAESEINSFRENPVEGNVDAIVSKIYACIGQAKKKAEAESKTNEQNSAKETETIDIFAEVNSANADDKEDIDIFN